jgi:hypothetical protein
MRKHVEKKYNGDKDKEENKHFWDNSWYKKI